MTLLGSLEPGAEPTQANLATAPRRHLSRM
jgi:hypothetical protein